MSGYPLAPLLRIRKIREQAAAAEVTACRHRLDEAGRVLQQRRDELAEYVPWRINREKELFAVIKNRPVPLARVDEMKAEMAAMLAREHHLEDQILLAEKVRDEAREALDKARENHVRTMREEQKIKEHRVIWNDEQRREAERLQDLELEEAASRPAGRHGLPKTVEHFREANHENFA